MKQDPHPNPQELAMPNDVPTSVPGNSGPGWTPPATPAAKPGKKGGEKLTTHVHTLTTKTLGQAFELWAASRGMSRSKALRGLMTDALWREAHGQPLGPLYGDLPPEVLERIVADLQARLHGRQA